MTPRPYGVGLYGAGFYGVTADFLGTFENPTPDPYSPFLLITPSGSQSAFARDTTIARLGTASGKFIAGSNTTVGTERYEVTYASGETVGDEFFYAHALHLPTGFTTPSWCIFYQLVTSNFTPPAAGMYLYMSNFPTDNRVFLALNTGDTTDGSADYVYAAATGITLTTGEWHDFIIQVRWRTAPTGLVNIWHRVQGGNWAQNVNLTGIPTLQTQSGVPAVIKLESGIYRPSQLSASSLYHDQYVQADSAVDAEFAAFGTLGFLPLLREFRKKPTKNGVGKGHPKENRYAETKP